MESKEACPGRREGVVLGGKELHRSGRKDWGGWRARCSYGSSSDGDDASAANGEEFVDSNVIEAGNCPCFPELFS